MRIFQKGFNFSQDGPGNRLVYHLQGCNLRCPWCSNPEGLLTSGGEQCTIQEMLEEVQRSRLMFFEGGGVTLTGGEVTMQFEEVKAFLTQLHGQGIHTCIETNGMAKRLPELFPVLDLLIMDIKHYDTEMHKAVTGLSNEITIQNISKALVAGQSLALRIPLIGGFNAGKTDAIRFAGLFHKLNIGPETTVELLPYHEYGKDKYAYLGMPYTMSESARISEEQIKVFTNILKTEGFNVIKT